MQFYARPIINNAAPILHATRARRPADPVRRGGTSVRPRPGGRRDRLPRAAAGAAAAGGVSEFIGDVELERGGDRLTADRLRYDKAADQADATGDIRLGNAAGDSL